MVFSADGITHAIAETQGEEAMKPRTILLTAAAATALAGGAAEITRAVGTDGSSGLEMRSGKPPNRADVQTPPRAKALLHNPGLPPSIP